MKKIVNLIKNLFNPVQTRRELTRARNNHGRFDLIEEALVQMINDKIYLEPGFSMSQLSQKTGVPYHQLTSYFNLYVGVTFNDWKNDLRIEYILDQLHQGRAKSLTLETIAREAGYLSRSNFVNSFVKKMNMCPSDYVNFLIKQKNAK
jgi:AraC-like DNA-binding protein